MRTSASTRLFANQLDTRGEQRRDTATQHNPGAQTLSVLQDLCTDGIVGVVRIRRGCSCVVERVDGPKNLECCREKGRKRKRKKGGKIYFLRYKVAGREQPDRTSAPMACESRTGRYAGALNIGEYRYVRRESLLRRKTKNNRLITISGCVHHPLISKPQALSCAVHRTTNGTLSNRAMVG